MATKLFFDFFTDVQRCNNDARADGTNTNGWDAERLVTTGPTGAIDTVNTVAGPTSGVEVGIKEWLSFPLSAAATISGTITINLWMAESAMAANVGAQVIIERINSKGEILSTLLGNGVGTGSERGVEVLSSLGVLGVNNWTATPVSTNFSVGDRIRVRVLGNDAGGNMSAGNSFRFGYGVETADTERNSWIEFNENLTFFTATPTGSTLYLLDAASDINPGSAVEKEAWTSRGSSSVTAVTNTPSGGWTPGVQVTNTAGGTAIEWYSKQLQAFTLSGRTQSRLRAFESGGGANAAVRLEIAICDADGSNPVIWGTSGMVGGELATTESNELVWVCGPTTNVLDGQRFRFRVYVDDAISGPINGGFTVTMSYNGPSTGAGDSWVLLPQTVTEYIAAGGPKYRPNLNVPLHRASGF